MERYNTESDIVDLINCRNPNGYKLLWENYSAILYGLIIRIVKDTEAAEDLLHETFEKICKNIDQYRDCQLSFLTKILQLARSVSIDYLCVTRQQSNADNYSVSDNAASSDGEDFELVIVQVNNEVKIFDMILLGYKVNEIAEKFNMTVDAVKISIRKGMKAKANGF